MAWIIRQILGHAVAKEVLLRRLQTQNNQAIARTYGVAHATIARWRERFHMPPFSRGGGHPSDVKAALLAYMQPGKWYSIGALDETIPGTRAQRYTMLHQLTKQGVLVRRGEPGAYIWRRLKPRRRTRRYR